MQYREREKGGGGREKERENIFRYITLNMA